MNSIGSILALVLFIPIAAVAIYLYVVFAKKNAQISKALLNIANQEGANYYRGLVEPDMHNSIMLHAKYHESFIQHSLRYDNGLEIGEAYLEIKDSPLLFDYATLTIPVKSDTHLIIDSNTNNQLGRSIMDTASKNMGFRDISLEGNFNKDFRVRMQDHDQIETLSILNPAAMQYLQDFTQRYDIEIVNQRVYIYALPSQAIYTNEKRLVLINDIRLLAAKIS